MNFSKRFLLLLMIYQLLVLYSVAQLKVSITNNYSSPVELFSNALQEMPAKDFSIKKKNNATKLNGKLTFAHTFDVNYTPENSGTILILPDGSKVWLLKIKSEGAYSLNIIFSKFNIPPQAQLWLYNSDKSYELGAYTALNNSKSQKLAIEPVPGDELLLEYIEPADVPFIGELQIAKVNHDFLNVFKELAGDGESASCNVDINCPEGNEWQIQKRAVLKTMINGRDLCSGALINTTANSGTPYFYTASHCGDTQTDAENWIFYFEYERAFCKDGTPPIKTLSGSDLIATSGNLDFTLVKLKDVPPPDFHPFYAGWDATGSTPNFSVTIHHPEGDVKKISRDNQAPQTATYPDNSYDSNVHWQIFNWEIGTTEFGSSGAPLFDHNKRIIGDLTGGEASCSNNINDYFQKFAVAWDKSELTNRQLKHWLDPNNSGVKVLDGYDPYLGNIQLDANLYRVIAPAQVVNPGAYVPEIMVYNNGNSTITSLQIEYKLNAQAFATVNWTGELVKHNSAIIKLPEINLPPGNFTFEVSIIKVNGTNDELPENNTIKVEGYARKEFDIRIVATEMPKTLCAKNLSPSIEIKNIGTGNVLSASVKMKVVNSHEISSNWSGLLAPEASSRVNFPDFVVEPDTANLIFWVESINGTNIPTSELIYYNFQVVKATNRLKYFMKTDNWPNEISWRFTGKDSGIISQSETYESGNSITINKDVCFTDSTVYFEIADEFNDGMCCKFGSGYFYVENIETGDILFTGGKFTNDIQTTFNFPKNELELYKIVSPDLGSEPGTIVPKIRVRNLGSIPVKEFTAKAMYYGNTLTANYSGTLNRYDSVDVSFSSINLLQGIHNIAFEIENTANTDFQLTNNKLSQSVFVNSGSHLEFQLKTDYKMNENAWQLTDSQGTIIAEADSLQANKLLVHNFWLPNGCYKLFFTDTAANGICCDFGNGYLTLLNKENNEIIVNESFFTEKTGIKEFCLTNYVTEKQINDWQVFPNPASTELFVENMQANSMHIKIFDLAGKLLYNTKVSQNKAELDISGFAAGIYRLQVVSDNLPGFNKLFIKQGAKN